MIKKFNVGVKGIIKTDQGYLILKHVKGHYDIPGGRIDDDEDFKDTLTRELGEELPGITSIEISDLIGAYRLHKDIDGDVSLVLLYFLVNAILPDPVVLSEEHTEYLFVKDMTSIPEGLNPEIDTVLRKLFA
jgi:8-oxo-dGTP pyrophosphatase MutT (NUDIX family)